MMARWMLLTLLWLAGAKAVNEPMTYEAAYAKAQREKKPLVVLVGADWCGACKTMKASTIAKMRESGDFDQVVYTTIDKDAQPDLARKLMEGNSLPQIVVFHKSDEGWKRTAVSGIQSENRMRELIRQAAHDQQTDRVIR
jgi:thiol:disulfide interchange protein